MKFLAILLAATTILAAPKPAKPPIAKKTSSKPSSKPAATVKHAAVDTLVLLYSASAKGQVRSCNCTKFRFGGYGRELTLLGSIRAECPDTLLLEGGDVTGGTGTQAELKAEVAAKALKLLGYQAMTIGEEELGLTGVRCLEKLDPASVPIVCANLHNVGDKAAAFRPYVVLETKNHLKVGVIGLIDPSFGGRFLEKGFGESISDPIASLKALAPKARAESDLVILLYHGPGEAAEKLAKTSGADLVLVTHRSDRTILFPTGESNEVEAPVEMHGKTALAAAQTSSNWSIGRIDLALTPEGKIKSAKHKLYYLDRRYEEDPEMVKIFDEYNVRVAEAIAARGVEFKDGAETLLVKRGLDPKEMRKKARKSPFASAEKCRSCHEEIHDTWSASRHAQAMADLEKTKQELDPECVRCHATGVMARHGFVSLKETPELANVQCEACHGPAAAHIESPSKEYLREAKEHVCRSCHTDDRDPKFDYDEAWAKVKH